MQQAVAVVQPLLAVSCNRRSSFTCSSRLSLCRVKGRFRVDWSWVVLMKAPLLQGGENDAGFCMGQGRSLVCLLFLQYVLAWRVGHGTARRRVEAVARERLQRRYKRQMEQVWSDLVYEAQWYSPLKQSMDAFIEDTQKYVSGDIRMVLHGGRATVNGRRSESSLYDFELATYDTGDSFDQSSSRGFIEIYGMQSKLAAARDVRMGQGTGF